MSIQKMKKKSKAKNPRVYIELRTVWGNGDAESSIKVSRRRWEKIQEGAEYCTSAWSWYEGSRYSVEWRFFEGNFCIYGTGSEERAVDLPVSELFVHITSPE
jgi:ribosomal protein L25 (general stress protein Ctc)